MRIADAVTGQGSLPLGEVGEVLIRAPQMMQGYWRRPDETAATLQDGWLLTGDLGYLDEEGYLFIVDRKKDLIKPSGFQVWPREVEEVIASHPAVDQVGVAGVPDPYQGEAVKAWVVLREGQQVTVDELRAYCREDAGGLQGAPAGRVSRQPADEPPGQGAAARVGGGGCEFVAAVIEVGATIEIAVGADPRTGNSRESE